MRAKFKQLKSEHEQLYEFIMFNLLSNISTITNFVVLNICTNFLFKPLSSIEFNFLFFHYTVAAGGLGGFLSFFVSFFTAQTTNFIVQRKLVFHADNKLGAAIPIYFITVAAVYVICLYTPTILMGQLTTFVGTFWAANLTNVINIMIQVIIIYPVLKFVVMRPAQCDQHLGSNRV